MASSEKFNDGISIGTYSKSNKLSGDLIKYIKGSNNNITFFCIGTDRSTGDCYAPLIGTMLEEKGYTNVIGTLDNPVHAKNLNERIHEIPSNTITIAIDSCLGRSSNIGKVQFNRGTLKAGTTVGKTHLIPVGDFNLKGIVNVDYGVSGIMNAQLLSGTRLNLVMSIARMVVNSIEEAFPLEDGISRVANFV